jgi:phage shock protein A
MSDYEDPQALRQYLLTIMTESKKFKSELTGIQSEMQVWAERVKLAAENGRSDLSAQAQIRLGEIKQKYDTRLAEKAALDRETSELKRKLLIMKDRPEMSVDADLLLSQFEMLLGETDELAESFKSEEADSMLNDLKQKMNE